MHHDLVLPKTAKPSRPTQTLLENLYMHANISSANNSDTITDKLQEDLIVFFPRSV
ncbi:hypothetical protein PILCRDRAFT_810085 [Piloderma croceum F 1598]|uniref:Uncharacterized protein n=1 Tax=Piloderma croceum (strain F 1598) TaxID=765440 RepID=A0A0C3GKD6_PILCF|nr:hypothetical protein PILCRDRAFT_810085 [Piloderma croceum F 1598]